METRLIEVNEQNLSEHPQVVCFINPKHETYHFKVDWLKGQFKNGLRIKLLYPDVQKRPFGFIEYVPGEYCWRAVDAKGYLFIHCLWTLYSTFNLIYNGKLLSDRYISTIRFTNIIKKETS